MPGPRYSITLAKEDFAFSAAHFTLFEDQPAELLHGHNYQVSLELRGEELNDLGLLVDIAAVKQHVREQCRALDERTLIPERAKPLKIQRHDDAIEVEFESRRYRFPVSDVLLLPLENVSMELVARMLWERTAQVLRGSRVTEFTLTLRETPGQAASYSGRL